MFHVKFQRIKERTVNFFVAMYEMQTRLLLDVLRRCVLRCAYIFVLIIVSSKISTMCIFVYSIVKFAFLCCVTDWKNHGSEYYECSRYKENPNIANESVHAQAREALKKYLFYFERVYTHVLLL